MKPRMTKKRKMILEKYWDRWISTECYEKKIHIPVSKQVARRMQLRGIYSVDELRKFGEKYKYTKFHGVGPVTAKLLGEFLSAPQTIEELSMSLRIHIAKEIEYNIKETEVYKDWLNKYEIENTNQLNPSEAMYGFVKLLINRKTKIIIDSNEYCESIMDLVYEFCKVNNLPQVTKNWAKKLILPKK